MSLVLEIGPTARLHLRDSPEESFPLTERAGAALGRAFAESEAAGLLCLGGALLEEPVSLSLGYWREFAGGYLTARCHQGLAEGESPAILPPPGEAELGGRILDAPPLPGGEYLSVELLARLWTELDAAARSGMGAAAGGPAEYFKALHPRWHLVGKVTFHLAENKRDEARPFAFLATYTHRLNRQSQPQFLPLARALQEYAGARQRAALDRLLEPLQRAAADSPWARGMLETRAVFAPQAWTPPQAFAFLRAVPELERAGIAVRLPNWWQGGPARARVRAQLGGRPPTRLGSGALLDFQVAVEVDGVELTPEEYARLRAAGQGLVFLRGKWVEVDAEKLESALRHWEEVGRQHPDGLEFLQGLRLLAGWREESAAEAGEERAAVVWSAGPWLEEVLQRLRQPERLSPVGPVPGLQATLRPYQEHGTRWLGFLGQLGLGACLADDMGLGKTVQVIAALLRDRADPAPLLPPGPNLLVVPASLVSNWEREIARFAPSLRLGVLHPSWEGRGGLWAAWQADPAAAAGSCDLVATTYGMTARLESLARVEWSRLILDEAQAIRNAGTKQARAVKRLRARARLALTGTPVENRLADLWSLFDFLNPGLLGNAREFSRWTAPGEDGLPARLPALRRLVAPYLLRRLKTDPKVISDLPGKTVMRAHCPLTARQAQLYTRLVEDLRHDLADATGVRRKGLVLTALMRCKQVCNHPSQVLGDGAFDPEGSGKWVRLRELAEEIASRQEKALLFTQFQEITGPLSDFLAGVFGRPGCVLHGGTPLARRRELVEAFQREDGPPFFVLTVKAGGTGLNLTQANHVIHFDRWWNPAVENQATDRAFRIGQRRPVLVHLFLTQGTVEEKIDGMLEEKRALAEGVLGPGEEISLTEMSDEQILRLVALDFSAAG